MQLESLASLSETVQQIEVLLVCSSSPEARQQIHNWREASQQPASESHRLLKLRKECLTQLKTFLEQQGTAATAVRLLRESAGSRGSWDSSKADELHGRIGEIATDLARLEADGVGIDGQLSKAHLQLSGELKDVSHPQEKTSCWGQVVALTIALEDVQRCVGWRQSEADYVGALWSSFREKKDEVMDVLSKVEEEATQAGIQESSEQAFQNRYVYSYIKLYTAFKRLLIIECLYRIEFEFRNRFDSYYFTQVASGWHRLG